MTSIPCTADIADWLGQEARCRCGAPAISLCQLGGSRRPKIEARAGLFHDF
jgi:hypothetical protein